MNRIFFAASIVIFFAANSASARCIGSVVNGKCLGTTVDYHNSNDYGDSSSNQPRYESNSGAQYQYDLNNPSDQMRYQYDYDAQRRDQLSTNPRQDLDKRSGQDGGGIYNNW